LQHLSCAWPWPDTLPIGPLLKNGVPCILPIKEGMASVRHLLRSLCRTLLIPHDLIQ